MLIVARSHKTAPYTLANQQIAWSYGKEKGSNKTNERHPAPSTPEGGQLNSLEQKQTIHASKQSNHIKKIALQTVPLILKNGKEC